MSDFFSGIYGGARGPDVVMNEGPLPPTSSAGMPAGFNGTPDAKIDYSSSLLGNMDPYAYGEPGTHSSTIYTLCVETSSLYGTVL